MNSRDNVRPASSRLSKYLIAAALLMGVVLIIFWIGWRAEGRRTGVRYFERRGGQVKTEPNSPIWLHDAISASLGKKRATVFTHIESVNLQDAQVGDTDLQNLSNLGKPEFANLKRLNLENTQITDESLQHLGALTNLERLILENTQVTDTGLGHVAVLKNLQALNLEETQVTDNGIPRITGLNGLKELSLNKTQVTDAALRHLWSLENLIWLDVRNSKVTEAGVQELQLHLPNCKVMHSLSSK